MSDIPSAIASISGRGGNKLTSPHRPLPLRPCILVIAAAMAGASQYPESALAADAGPDTITSAAARHGANSSDPASKGIWKAIVPPAGTMHGEFENNDPIGLAAGAKIPADCSINWVDPDTHKLYCFSSATSLSYFLDAPHTYLTRVKGIWPDVSGTTP